jgi:hypothetical protein
MAAIQDPIIDAVRNPIAFSAAGAGIGGENERSQGAQHNNEQGHGEQYLGQCSFAQDMELGPHQLYDRCQITALLYESCRWRVFDG